MKLFILVVIYNKNIKNIRSINEFIALKNQYDFVNIIIVDNSDDNSILSANKADAIMHYQYYNYYSNNGNIGLSKAYNVGLAKIKECTDNYYIMISDDDTFFSLEYLYNVIRSIRSGKSHLYCGIVKTEGELFSPTIGMRLSAKQYVKTPGCYSDIIAINSGLVFDSYIADNISLFNEALFIDMIDYWFGLELKRKKLNYYEVLDGEITQDFSGKNLNIDERTWKRYYIYRKDCFELSKCFPQKTFSIMLLLFKRKTKLLLCSVFQYIN